MRRKYSLLLGVFALVVLADQGTKYLAVASLTNALEHANRRTLSERVAGYFRVTNLDNDPATPDGIDHRRPPAVVVPGYWNHKYVENPGAAWGLLARVSDRWRVPFFHAVSLLALFVILSLYRGLEADQRLVAFALALVLGGAIGNYLDRILKGYVVDFIDWHWRDQPGLHWPTFNLADSAIVVGVLLMLSETLFVRRPLPAPGGGLADAPAPVADAAAPKPDSLAHPATPPGGGASQP